MPNRNRGDIPNTYQRHTTGVKPMFDYLKVENREITWDDLDAVANGDCYARILEYLPQDDVDAHVDEIFADEDTF